MAIVHKATLTPSKDELLSAWLDGQAWAPAGATTRLGSYRFDDPDGEVGVEGMIFRRGDTVLHVPVAYRAAPLAGADDALIGTLHHSVLGERWVYDAIGDPVAAGCFAAGLRGEIEPAVFEVYDGPELVERRPAPVAVRVEGGSAGEVDVEVAETDVDGRQLRLARVLGEDIDGARRLVAAWDGGEAVVATLD